ncbi:hypothetical protein G6L37_01200 [Agrobacterium rubi]|nr:hypothetical protein [Agrobacterium rubi]NTF24008.1 hypothetical protein [Agrobacterium rubi]
MDVDTWDRDELRELEQQIDLTSEQIAQLRMTDVEASSLHKGSHPIEVASCGLDMVPEAMLIRPLDHWDDWSVASQAVHNITQEMLRRDGIDAKLVALRVNALLAGNFVFSDAPEFDGNWFMRLFVDVDVKPMFRIQDYDALFLPCRKIAATFMGPQRLAALTRKVDLVYLHTHRAADDALRMAAGVRVLVDQDWAEWFEKADYEDLLRSQGRDPSEIRRRRK